MTAKHITLVSTLIALVVLLSGATLIDSGPRTLADAKLVALVGGGDPIPEKCCTDIPACYPNMVPCSYLSSSLCENYDTEISHPALKRGCLIDNSTIILCNYSGMDVCLTRRHCRISPESGLCEPTPGDEGIILQVTSPTSCWPNCS